jgi:lysine biosynthesis protein LysW
MLCPECNGEISLEEYKNGDIVMCQNCGCEMELMEKEPLDVRVIEEEK